MRVSKARLVIKRCRAREAARARGRGPYGVSRSRIYELALEVAARASSLGLFSRSVAGSATASICRRR